MKAGRRTQEGSRTLSRQEHPEQMEAAGLREGREQRKALCYMGAYKKGHPPLLPERQEPSTPIIFRTKNTEKSRLGLIGKNFGKNLRENVSGEEKAPNPEERGRGAKI